MTTLTLKIPIKEQLAEAYRKAHPSEKLKIKHLFNLLLEKTLLHDQARSNMYAVLTELHVEAQKNGLTDDILEEILARN